MDLTEDELVARARCFLDQLNGQVSRESLGPACRSALAYVELGQPAVDINSETDSSTVALVDGLSAQLRWRAFHPRRGGPSARDHNARED